MKPLIKKTVLLTALLALTGCFRNDIRTETFKIEQLRSEEGAQLIAKALSPINGIKDIKANITNRTITITFDGLQAYIKNIEYPIVKAGFDLPNWPADPADKAKLPEALR